MLLGAAQVKRGTPDHPKMRRLARALMPVLGISREIADLVAPGLMERLWHFTGTYAPTGDLTPLDPIDLVEGVRWPRAFEELVEVLAGCGWLDRDGDRILVHDWADHAEDSTRKRLERAGERFASGAEARKRPARVSTEEVERLADGATASRQDRDGGTPALPSHALPSHASPPPRRGRANGSSTRATAAPDDLSPEQWARLWRLLWKNRPWLLCEGMEDRSSHCSRAWVRLQVQETLSYWRSVGKTKADWVETCAKRIYQLDSDRWEKLGKGIPVAQVIRETWPDEAPREVHGA